MCAGTQLNVILLLIFNGGSEDACEYFHELIMYSDSLIILFHYENVVERLLFPTTI